MRSIENISVGQQQRVEILKALYRGAEILILDEPTGVLTPNEADELFRILDVLRSQGKTIILITHKLREIMAATDSVSVMRQGAMVQTLETKRTNPEQARRTDGRPPRAAARRKGPRPPRQGTVLDVENLVVIDDLKVHPRKRCELFRARRRDRRHCRCRRQRPVRAARIHRRHARPAVGHGVKLNGTPLSLEGDDGAHRARHAGLAHVPEDRLRMGLVMPSFEEWENSILGYEDEPQYGRGPILDIAAGAASMPKRACRPTISVRPTCG
jgi:ABC-type uncharacterized transport system ATPase subunit